MGNGKSKQESISIELDRAASCVRTYLKGYTEIVGCLCPVPGVLLLEAQNLKIKKPTPPKKKPQKLADGISETLKGL